MNSNKNDAFFAIYIRGKENVLIGGMAIRIPHNIEGLPGAYIKVLMIVVRSLALLSEQRVQTEMLVAPPVDLVTNPLSDYLWADGTLNNLRLQRHLESWLQGRPPHRFIPRTGVPALGQELIGRDKVYNDLKNALTSGHSCHLRAPRRYGKTSLLMRLEEQLPNVMLMQLEDAGSLPGFLKTLLRACLKQDGALKRLLMIEPYKEWFHDSLLGNPNDYNRAFEKFVKSKGAALVACIREITHVLAEEDIIVLIDEFSVFLRDMHHKKDPNLAIFLEIFKEIRTRQASPLTVALAGSAGLSTYITFGNLGKHFDDLQPVDVCPIKASEARILAEELLYGMGKRPLPEAVQSIVLFAGGDDTVPYFVHALAHVCVEEVGQKVEINVKDVKHAYWDRLLGPSGNHFFRDFLLRERAYPHAYRNSASAILKELSRRFPEAVSEIRLKEICQDECDFSSLMTCLEEHYDLVEVNGAWRMRSKVLADRWRLGEPWLTQGGSL